MKHVAWCQDVWNNDTKLLIIWAKIIQENSNWESNSDTVELDLPKRTEYVESITEHF